VVVVIFVISLVYARMQGPVAPTDVDTLKEKAEEILKEEAYVGERKGRG